MIQDLTEHKINTSFMSDNVNMLSHEITIIIPETLDSSWSNVVKSDIATRLTDLFGGCTVTVGKGYYKSNGTNELIIEDVTLINSSVCIR